MRQVAKLDLFENVSSKPKVDRTYSEHKVASYLIDSRGKANKVKFTACRMVNSWIQNAGLSLQMGRLSGKEFGTWTFGSFIAAVHKISQCSSRSNDRQ